MKLILLSEINEMFWENINLVSFREDDILYTMVFASPNVITKMF